MATSPTSDPSVAAATMPALEAGKPDTHSAFTHTGHHSYLKPLKHTGLWKESFHGARTGDDFQVNGAAVRAGGVARSADVLPWHAFSEVTQPEGALSLVCKQPQSYTQSESYSCDQ